MGTGGADWRHPRRHYRRYRGHRHECAIAGSGFVVWGPIAAALAGAGAGGLTGGLVGALVGWGIPRGHAKEYETGIRNGGTVLGVNPRTDDDADYFEKEWRTNYKGENIYR